ncbi:hypothetical protein COS75_00310 [Candidatus Pacearchaeota archaeon CG06_land_8_20_14_3_00_35_12]|nr:MAG: hypothetical protein COS75_00310 [Candidatus Pacearchaeota archaeon CG06_land_8_20_14_3_00_35_12]
MSYTISVGFPKKPDKLVKFLAAEGFKHGKFLDDDTFTFFNKKKSARKILLIYTENILPAEPMLEYCKSLEAKAIISAPAFRNEFDIEKQEKIAKLLKEKYKAFLYSPTMGLPYACA